MVAHLRIKKKVSVNTFESLNLRLGFDYQAENFIYMWIFNSWGDVTENNVYIYIL